MSDIGFKERVVIVTGAGRGLGKSYALDLASRGARVVVNDLGSTEDGSRSAAEDVVDMIRQDGGDAVVDFNSVATVEGANALVKCALDAYGRIDAVVNNAGILRDASLAKMTPEQFDEVIDVHLRGSFFITRAVFPLMKEQGFGRLVYIASAAGLFGNFGQANYASAKMGLVGLSNVVAVEGKKYDIKANVVAPAAKTRMTEAQGELVEPMKPECVAPFVAYLCSEECKESHNIYSVGAGRFARAFVGVTPGWFPGLSATPSAREIADNMDLINSDKDYVILNSVVEEAALFQSML